MGCLMQTDQSLGRQISALRNIFDSSTRRFPLAFQFFFIFILYGTVPWLPESPRWLIAHGGIDEAEQIIADLEGTTVDDPWVVTESKEIQWAVRSPFCMGLLFRMLT